MNRRAEHIQIVLRCEQVRSALGLSKSAFAGAFGMRPQTYNNFVGTQGSKPNVELILGVVEAHQVNATWLLTGRGLCWPYGRHLSAEPQPQLSDEDVAAIERLTSGGS